MSKEEHNKAIVGRWFTDFWGKPLARNRHVTGFPEFEQFYIAGFPVALKLHLSPMRLPVPPQWPKPRINAVGECVRI